MLRRWNLMIIFMAALTTLWGCGDEDTITNPPGETAFEAMAKAGAAYINESADCPGVLNAGTLFDNLADYTVIDIRSQADYDAGHIEGAYHSTLATLLVDLETTIPKNKPYVIACYTGQSAGHAKIAMELLDYTDVYSLLFGMSAWNSSLASSWTDKCADNLGNPETVNNNPGLAVHDFPTLAGEAGTIVQTRVAWMLQQGFKGKMYADIRDNFSEYFVVNYFGEADYLGQGTSGVPGHIPDAFQFTPYQSLGSAQMLENLPSDMPIIVYCWTGQHSSQVTAYLNMLGYEAYSLKFGSNNLFHSALTAHKWTTGAQYDFPLVPTP